jgi:uncharacterized membrane protein YhaH (DUF805 family)
MILPLKRYAQFSGRSRRQEFWLYSLFVVLLWIALFMLVGVVFGAAMSKLGTNAGPESVLTSVSSGGFAALGLMVIVWLALLIPGIAVSVRRMHDTDRSGWWAGVPTILYYGSSLLSFSLTPVIGTASVIVSGVLSLIWFVTAIIFLVFACLDGTRGPNRFGPDPKGPDSDLESVFS